MKTVWDSYTEIFINIRKIFVRFCLTKGIRLLFYMHYLKDLDQVAYVRFASIYREFKDVNTFMDELKKMLDK